MMLRLPEAPAGITPRGYNALIAAELKRRRVAAGLSQSELAWRARLRQSRLSSIERGAAACTTKEFLALREALG